MRALIALLAVACSAEPAALVEPSAPIEARVGVHALTLVAPRGFEHLDHGREHRFDAGTRQISLADLGPVTPAAFTRAIEAARELWHSDRPHDARQALSSLKLRALFRDHRRWQAIEPAWESIRRGRDDVDAGYERVLAELERLPAAELAELTESALAAIDEDERRDVAEIRETSIDGRPARIVDTWERLTHAGRRRHLFVLADGHLLVLRMESGAFERLEIAFERIAASLAFRTTSS